MGVVRRDECCRSINGGCLRWSVVPVWIVENVLCVV